MLLKIFGPNSKPYITNVRVSQGLAPDIVLWICAEKITITHSLILRVKCEIVSRKCGYITCFGCPGEWPPCPPATSCYVLVQHAIRLEKICENARVSIPDWLLGIRPKPGKKSHELHITFTRKNHKKITKEKKIKSTLN